METHLPQWTIDLFSRADALSQSAVLIVLLAATCGLLYANLRKRLRVKELLVERADLRNQLREQEFTVGALRSRIEQAMVREETLHQEVLALRQEVGRLSQALQTMKEKAEARERYPAPLRSASPAPRSRGMQRQTQTSW